MTISRLSGCAFALVLASTFTACSEDPPASGSNAGAGGVAAGVGGGSGGSVAPGGKGGSTSVGGSSGSAGQAAGASQGGTAGSGATTSGGSAGKSTGGSGTGGGAGTGGSGGAGAGGAGAGGAGGAGASGASGAGGAGGAGSPGTGTCPAGVTGTPTISGTPTRVTSVPPSDSFNMNNGTFGIVEGPVWLGDALYVSELGSDTYDAQSPDMRKSRILKVTSDGQTSIFVADSGSNGIAIDADGNLVAGVHKDGSISKFAMPSGMPKTAIVSMFMGARFDSPNDLTIHSNGTIYFSDPSYQAPKPVPQSQTRAYRVPPGGQAEPIPSAASPDTFNNPNGVSLSPAQDFLYVTGSVGRRYPVMPDGTLGAGADFTGISGGDGMAIDCAGNIYVAIVNQNKAAILRPDGSMISTITVTDLQSVTNLAFGGADHKTLYITGLGNNKGLFKVTSDIPGLPY